MRTHALMETKAPRASVAAPRAPWSPVAAKAGCACGGTCPRCTGAVLPVPLRRSLETRMGADFTRVRIHSGDAAAQAAAAANAHAFTIGNDIVFGAGRFAPGTTEGTTRLAHELVHVEQQRRGGGGSGAGAEAEARQLGAAAAAGARVQIRGSAPVAMQRDGPVAPEPTTSPLGIPQLHLDPEIEKLIAQNYVRWWIGTTLTQGTAPATLPAPAEPRPNLSLPQSLPATIPQQLPLPAAMYQPLPASPLFIQPDLGAIFSPFATRGAPVGPGDYDAVMSIYEGNQRLVAGMPDLRSLAPPAIRKWIPSTWRRSIAGALTAGAVNSGLKRDFPTVFETSDRAWENMTGASTTMIPIPGFSF